MQHLVLRVLSFVMFLLSFTNNVMLLTSYVFLHSNLIVPVCISEFQGLTSNVIALGSGLRNCCSVVQIVFHQPCEKPAGTVCCRRPRRVRGVARQPHCMPGRCRLECACSRLAIFSLLKWWTYADFQILGVLFCFLPFTNISCFFVILS